MAVADIVRDYAAGNDLPLTDGETIAAKLIADTLHFAMRAGEMDGLDGRKVALAAARRGLGRFITDVHTAPVAPPPAVYTLIRPDGWRSLGI